MDILEEVAQVQNAIDELLYNLYQITSCDETKLADSLPETELHKLRYLRDTHDKLKDDDFSLSEKGLANYRAESQSLIGFLELKSQKQSEAHAKDKQGNRLFNYKAHILNWYTPISWPILIFHSMSLVLGACTYIFIFIVLYKATDENYLIALAGFISYILLQTSFSTSIQNDNYPPTGKTFSIVATSFLLWKSLINLLPFAAIGIVIVKYKSYWADDIILILAFGLPLIMYFTLEKSHKWLEQAPLSKENTSNIEESAENA